MLSRADGTKSLKKNPEWFINYTGVKKSLAHKLGLEEYLEEQQCGPELFLYHWFSFLSYLLLTTARDRGMMKVKLIQTQEGRPGAWSSCPNLACHVQPGLPVRGLPLGHRVFCYTTT